MFCVQECGRSQIDRVSAGTGIVSRGPRPGLSPGRNEMDSRTLLRSLRCAGAKLSGRWDRCRLAESHAGHETTNTCLDVFCPCGWLFVTSEIHQ